MEMDKQDLQRGVKYSIMRMTPEELKALAASIAKMADQLVYDPQAYLNTATVVSLTISGHGR